MSRKAATGDSLDLLLDTICNTFGGILFIAMLVVILTNKASQDAAPSTPTAESSRTLRKLRGELTESESRLTKLRRAVRQKEDLERRFADPESLALLESLRSLDENSDSLMHERAEKLSDVAESQADLEDTARKLEQLAEQMAQARERLRKEKENLEREASVRARTSAAPQQRTTQKLPLVFFLKGGRLSSYASRDTDGSLVHNEAETKVTEEAPGKKYVEPVSGSGLVVAIDDSNAEEIARRLSGFDKQRFHLTVFVFKDSFGQFESLKNQMIRSGFEYRLLPIPDDAKVYIGDQTEPVFVQ
ncbi:MAG TPA: hypothetical protein PLR25_29565 [Planctomycetaceae bacterium]|nr:hypothetical protein [Planctomycetaceae bacterium]